MIAAACHCPDTVELDEWLPHWVADYLYVPDGPDLGAKMAAAIACAPGRLSAEEVAELLPTTFDDRQWMKLWTFGACDMTPHKAYTEIWRCGRTDETDPARLAEAAKELASIPVDVIVASRIKSGRFSTNSLMRVLYLAVPTIPDLETSLLWPLSSSRNLASVHFRPDRLVFQDSVATTAGLQPFDPAAA